MPQLGETYSGQYMNGTVTEFDGENGMLTNVRIRGPIQFNAADAPQNGFVNMIGKEVMFKMSIGSEGQAVAKMIVLRQGGNAQEMKDRMAAIIDSLHGEGYIDDKAVESLKNNSPPAIAQVLPSLDFYKTENPSAFILGALSRMKWGSGTETWDQGGGDWGWNQGWGGGKGKGQYSRYQPY